MICNENIGIKKPISSVNIFEIILTFACLDVDYLSTFQIDIFGGLYNVLARKMIDKSFRRSLTLAQDISGVLHIIIITIHFENNVINHFI